MQVILIILCLSGLLSAIFPKVSWYASNWWKFNGDVEPSPFSLMMYRLGGIMLCVVTGLTFIYRFT